MDGITQDDVIQILRMLEESSFEELRLEMGDVKLEVSKSGKKTEPEGDFKINRPETEVLKASAQTSFESVPETPTIGVTEDFKDENLTAIKAPMLGTFYRAPKPGAPPFVEIGQTVSENDSLCIIEVMKLFNTLKAGRRGQIVKICAENGALVEYQQTLFLIKEATDTEKRQEKAS